MIDFLFFLLAPFAIVLGLFAFLSFMSDEIDKNEDML
jgi:hypothetical protein